MVVILLWLDYIIAVVKQLWVKVLHLPPYRVADVTLWLKCKWRYRPYSVCPYHVNHLVAVGAQCSLAHISCGVVHVSLHQSLSHGRQPPLLHGRGWEVVDGYSIWWKHNQHNIHWYGIITMNELWNIELNLELNLTWKLIVIATLALLRFTWNYVI